jgi:hypothetical protein
MHAVGRHRCRPAAQRGGVVLGVPEVRPLRGGSTGHVGAELLALEVGERRGVAELDLLLPVRGRLPPEVAGRDDHLDVETSEGREGGCDLGGLGPAEDLVADDAGAVVLADPVAQCPQVPATSAASSPNFAWLPRTSTAPRNMARGLTYGYSTPASRSSSRCAASSACR